MAQKINLNKEVFNKVEYQKTINTNFTQLGVQTTQQQVEEQPTVEEFFTLYNDLFYDIPEIGETDSHEFLVKTSGEYIDFDENDELIQALQDEISQLREDLLEAQQQLIDQQTQQPNNP